MSFNLNALAYPEIIIIDNTEHSASRKGNTVKIPYTDEPDVGIGDTITQKSGKRVIELKVLDVSFLPGGTLQVGTKHKHMLIMEVEIMTASEHKSKNHNSVVK
ncbi:hypothetical protein LGZ99_16695 [Photorhabdus temperata]|uniref:Uncharacterized protein n=2 Tax=Photorhabdus temperata TaxID=574560 RepID=A0A081RSS1_PHOTE|nr:hypothetical protein [Photorhabdus temperata]ERT11889.1 hypothetical protein O185_17030 [Photorhabdus temperata J3]KER01724.1 hypothetical protein MEG1DRAFT_03681 [Photorhabdus temperata subsp. temperata Meg1]MCT8348784.1 hypothetical protein [Photorhabdus temperata]